jgi:signal transduction histidine kinase
VLVLALLAAGISERVVGRRLRSLATAMRGVERGNLAIRVEGEAAGGDEVSELARGFNNMIARVGEADAAIRAFNQRLADEVQKATRDLADKNDALVETNRLLIAARRELGDKERLAALGQLAAQLAHEVGTPLSSVSGHLQLALARGDAPAALQERLEIAHREVERVSRIIRDYLDSTRPVAPEMERVATEQLLREAVEIALGPPGPAAAPGGRVDVETEIAPDAALLWTDAALVRQIVVNLVTNARDAVEAAPARGDRAGRVRVRAYRAPAQVGEGGVSIEVRDAGHGISPAELERIFEPFYTTKGRGKGTGLGLAICRELARTVGGRIEVESGAGVGSAFTLVLPAREAGAVAAAPGAVAQGAA